MTLRTNATVQDPAGTPSADGSPCSPRDKIIARMLAAAEEMRACGLDVHAVPVGSDLVDCRGAVKHLAVTSSDVPGRGRILITREGQTQTVKATWEIWIPIRDDAGIRQLVDHITPILNGPNHSQERD